MTVELHLDPDRLHTHARRLGAILEAMVPVPALDDEVTGVLASSGRGSAVLVEFDRMGIALGGAAAELAELAAVLDAVATGVLLADGDAARSILRAGRDGL